MQRFVNSPAFGKPVSSKGTSREPRPHRSNNEELSVDVPCFLEKWPLVASTWTIINCHLFQIGNWQQEGTRGDTSCSLFETSSNVSTSLYLTLSGTYNNRKTPLKFQQRLKDSRNLHDLGVEEKARDRLKRRFITLATCLACISFHRNRGGSRTIRKIFVGRSLTTESTASGHTFTQLLAVALARTQLQARC